MANKPARAPFVLQVLTAEHIIEGTAPGDTIMEIPSSRDYWYPIALTDVHILTPGLAKGGERSVAKFMAAGNGMLAMIPRADPAALERYDQWKAYKDPRPGEYHLGPYILNGRMMFLGSDRFNPAVPMYDVKITHATKDLGELSAPLMLVNTAWLSGYVPA